jgi:hypothetical protein
MRHSQIGWRTFQTPAGLPEALVGPHPRSGPFLRSGRLCCCDPALS